MYYLEDKERKFILFWSPRVACMSLKYWFHGLTETEMPPSTAGQKVTCEKMQRLDCKKIIVVRNPIDRFVSILNHTIIYRYIEGRIPDPHKDANWGFVKHKGRNRIDPLLDYIEKNGVLSDHHFELQCFSHDNPKYHIDTNVSKMMTHVVKIEDNLPAIGKKSKNNPEKLFPSVIPELNRIVGTESVDWTINTGKDARTLFSARGIEYLEKADLTGEQINRIKKLYHYDFLYFYPGLL